MTARANVPPASRNYLAFDLGAESGRGVLGHVRSDRIELQEIHRFPNEPVPLLGHLHWDVLGLFRQIEIALGKAAQAVGPTLHGVGVDTWAVDFGLLAPDGSLLGHPYHYRDSRTDGMMEAAFARVGERRIFEETGIQFLKFNTLYQLLALQRSAPGLLEAADKLLMMGELLLYLLSGKAVAEFSNATTTQLYNPRTGDWSSSLLDAFGIPRRLMPSLVAPGTVLGPLLSDIAQRTGAGPVPVIAPAVHDTGSAVAAVPAGGQGWCYISSGTWSLVGVETRTPCITAQALQENFTNEGGVEGTFRLLKNVMGLWLWQCVRRDLARSGQRFEYSQMTELAQSAPPFAMLVDPDDDRFLAPDDMLAAVSAVCAEQGVAAPADVGTLCRSLVESLALKYRFVIERLEQLTGQAIRTIHIVGGGSQNGLLNQFTADATGRTVVAGPTEASALGNLIMQAVATGQLASAAEGRRLIARSFEPATFSPNAAVRGDWEAAYARFSGMLEKRRS